MTGKTQTELIDNQVDVIDETTKFTLGVGIAAAIMVGIWAVTCMASVMLNNGSGEVFKGLFTAITGN